MGLPIRRFSAMYCVIFYSKHKKTNIKLQASLILHRSFYFTTAWSLLCGEGGIKSFQSLIPSIPSSKSNGIAALFLFSCKPFKQAFMAFRKTKRPAIAGPFDPFCGEGGIRTRGTLQYTNFPSLHVRPL